MNAPTDPTPNEIMSRLTDTAAQMPVPGDGLSRIDARVTHRRRRRTTERALAAVATFVLVVGGVAVLAGQRDDEGLPVVTDPTPAVPQETPTYVPIAPASNAWWVSGYNVVDISPRGRESYYALKFAVAGVQWELDQSTAEANAANLTAPGSRVEKAHAADGTEVEITGWSEDPSVLTKTQAIWTDLDGGPMMLSLHSPDPAKPRPTTEEILAIVDDLSPVAHDEWVAALIPPDGAPNPETGDTVRPLHLGFPIGSDPTDDLLALSPWNYIQAEFSMPGMDPNLSPSMSVRTDVDPSPRGEPVQVRGVEGTWSDNGGATRYGGPDGMDPSAPDEHFEMYRLAWEESGSWIELTAYEPWTMDDVIAFANSLVVLDDTQWQALLFPPD